jgi:5-hydroxyisourate hydrolase
MSRITTHILDVVLGKPASGVSVRLEHEENGEWSVVTNAETDGDGRCQNLAADARGGVYRMTFATGAYFARQGRSSIYPVITLTFQCAEDAHYHLPILLSDNSYTTYRGS